MRGGARGVGRGEGGGRGGRGAHRARQVVSADLKCRSRLQMTETPTRPYPDRNPARPRPPSTRPPCPPNPASPLTSSLSPHSPPCSFRLPHLTLSFCPPHPCPALPCPALPCPAPPRPAHLLACACSAESMLCGSAGSSGDLSAARKARVSRSASRVRQS